MFLLDTNIILELFLDQERAEDAEQFLRDIPPEQLYLSEFALYSLGIILFRYGQHDAFVRMVEDLLVIHRIRLVRLGEGEMQSIVQAARRFGLDFDDAYQYAIAERYDLTIVSFDGDFDQTERGRQTPGAVLAR